jgi:hypothetical protein
MVAVVLFAAEKALAVAVKPEADAGPVLLYVQVAAPAEVDTRAANTREAVNPNVCMVFIVIILMLGCWFCSCLFLSNHGASLENILIYQGLTIVRFPAFLVNVKKSDKLGVKVA